MVVCDSRVPPAHVKGGVQTSMRLCVADVAVPSPDKKSIIMYVTSLFRVFPQSVSMEAIQEVEKLSAAFTGAGRAEAEEHYQIQTQQRFSQQVQTHHHLTVGHGLFSRPAAVCIPGVQGFKTGDPKSCFTFKTTRTLGQG